MLTVRWFWQVLLTALLLTGVATADSSVDRWWERHECLHGKLELWQHAELASWDEATGADKRQFPRDRVVDYLHMKLQMRFENLNDMRFSATETLSFEPIGTATTSLTLDAVDLSITRIAINGGPVEHFHDGKKLTLRFNPPLETGRKHEIVAEYVCDHPVDGMFFTPYLPEAPHYAAEVHTQGQAETNRYWFIAHDYPNDRMTTELIVNVPAQFSVSSNGRLVSHLVTGDRAVWHYLQDKPHVSYLVSLVIGEFDVVRIPHARVPMHVWVPKGLGDRVIQTYGRTGEMIDVFEHRLGVPYPWDRYDQLVVKNFGAGGMENTSATSMYPSAILDANELLDTDLDGLIAHELMHQWTGDMITCKSWAHIWLNEGWATYGEALWFEKRYGTDGYLDDIRDNFRVARRDTTDGEIGMVSNIYDSPDETFRRRANPYPKGASILHMLRMMLGDDVFFRGVKAYMQQHHLGVVETDDFRYAMEEASGLGLEWFFDQWCYRPGCPQLKAKVQYDGSTRELFVDVEQTQKLDAQTPAMRFLLPVHAVTKSGEHVFKIDVREKTTSFRTTLDAPPTQVVIDPHMHVLKTIETDKPLAMWIEQAKQGSTVVARHEALEAIRGHDLPETIELAAALIRDKGTRYTLRQSAVAAMGAYGSQQAKDMMLALAREGLDEARVRSNVVRQLEKQDKDSVLALLIKFASEDPSYDTRVAAINALAKFKAKEHVDLIAELVHFESQHQQVRNAALRALRDLEDNRALDLAIQYSAYGNLDRARAETVSIIADVAKQDRDRAVDYLIGMLHDPEPRPQRAAGRALAAIGDERALEPLRAMASSHKSPEVREAAAGWVKQIEEKQNATGGVDASVQGRRGRLQRPG